MKFRVWFFFLALAVASGLRAEVSLPRVFADHMVFQRDVPAPVWGRAAPGELVVVHFAGQEKRATTDNTGVWRVVLSPLTASAESRDLVVSGANTIALHDVLVGEVWLCAGQSNIEMALGVSAAGAPPESTYDAALARDLPTMTYPNIRLFKVAQKSREVGDLRSDAGWAEGSGAALAGFSAAGFFFGREIQTALDVPVGLILAAWGGSRLEEWISDAAYAPLETILGDDAARSFDRNPAIVSRNYDAMIAPLAPFAVRGVLWYQGEANILFYNDGIRYADKFAALVADWRARWSAPELPFYSVQLAPFMYSQFKGRLAHAEDELPKLWEAQQLTTAIPHTGVVPIGDTVDDVRNVHPPKKSVVGHRLALLALAATYGKKDVIATGPVFRRIAFRDSTAIVHFDGAEGGLVTNDHAAPSGFEVAGADGLFVTVNATINGDTIEVTASEVSRPLAVRYCWHETARPSLTNRAGWPAFAFRSDGPSWKRPHG